MATQAMAPRAGISGLVNTASRAPVALQGVDVRAHATGASCRVVIRQRFRNHEDVPLELVYVFPLDEGAAVCGFEATVGGRRFVGQVKEREQAFADYDDAMAEGHGAFLLDEERPDVFTASLGNVEPGAEVDLSITYVTKLAAEGADLRFTLPTTVSPRYAPAEDRTGVGQAPAEVLNPPTEFEVPYRFTFTMDLEMPGEIARVESPTHPMSVERRGAGATVTLTQRDAAMDRDLVLLVGADGLDQPHAVVERSPAGLAAAVTLVPRFDTASHPAEVVFLVDRSGSMGGTSIEEVRNALVLCLRGLTHGCRFDIVGFGSRFESLFGGTVPYDDGSLSRATAFVETMDADLGGTEIQAALTHVLTRPASPELPLQVVLLTDGEVTNTDAVIALARQHAGHARIFTFGIGAGASAHLVRAVARASGGAAEFIAPGERIEAKVLRQFRRVLAPAITNVRVEWPERVIAAPDVPPCVFDGECLALYGLGDGVPEGRVVLSGTRGGSPFTAEIALPAPVDVEAPVVGALAARARIRDLEEKPEYLSAKGSRRGRARVERATGEEIVKLGVAYQLASRETSFVAIEHREVPTTRRAELRRVPIALTSGWGGRTSVGQTVVMSSRAVHRLAAPQEWMTGNIGLHADLASAGFAPPSSRRLVAPAPSVSEPPSHVRLVRLQRADGSWRFEADLERAVGQPVFLSLRWLKKLTAADDALRHRVLATALALAWLEAHAAGFADEWVMAADKARAWLRDCGVTTVDATTWEELGRMMLA